MAKFGNILLLGLLALLLINGIRLTFFPDTACGLVRRNQIEPLSQSVMEFHREQALRTGSTEEKENANQE